MKILDIAFKDLLRSLKTPFALIMMFGAPLLITGLLYFAFGSLAGGGDLDLQTVRVQVANLDRPATQGGDFAAGQMLVGFLQSEDLGDLLAVTLAEDEAAARAAVEDQQADVALIIPPDFTAAALAPDKEATVVQYEDPTLTIGPGIVEDLVSQFIDGFAGAKITAGVVSQQVPAGGTVAQEAAREYAAWLESSGHDHEGGGSAILESRAPEAAAEPAGEGAGTIGAIMVAMTIFFAFFMGANSAESIIREDEEGTLERLFTTPTSQAIILGGKFTAVVLTLVIQVVVLLLASGLIFGIRWGRPLTVGLVTTGLIVVAAGFGVMLMSFVKNTRQTGPVMGGVLTLTGMLGGLFTSGVPNIPEIFDTVRLAMPQGWAMYAWELTLQGAGVSQVLGPVAVMLGLGALFFGIGVVLFRKRFA
ncbi:MAG: ABC transporter permease [Anaerolineae bacterium]|jgi:ABC-2 type transport system permease protein